MEKLLTESSFLLDILLSALLGIAIGFERKMRAKEAGIGTHAIVCLGSCLLMIISKYGFEGEQADKARIAAQIVSGIGFLGAGIIVYRNREILGLTTAAGIWATAGVGMACGSGMYYLAIGTTIIVILVQILVHSNIKLFNKKHFYMLDIEFKNDDFNGDKVKQLFNVEHFGRLVINRTEQGIVCLATIKTDKEFQSQVLNKIMQENEYIISIERVDDD